MAEKMHVVQRNILTNLQYATRARYSELMKASGVDSDIFKFHISKLRRLNMAIKMDDGLYELTAEGKAYISRLDPSSGRQIEQPKSSMLMLVTYGDEYVLAHRRTREPFNGFWGIASAPLLRGIELNESARREFLKQTGIDADFQVAGFYRVIDKNQRGTILEDKIFAIMHSSLSEMPIPAVWQGGSSEWMLRDDLLKKNKLFPTTYALFDMLDRKDFFAESSYVYKDDEY